MEQAFEPAPSPDQKRNWIPLLVGLIAVVVAVGAIFLFLRPKSQGGIEANPYAEKLKLSDIKLSAAENYMGGTVTYLDFNITNSGDKALVGADVKAQFEDTMGQIVQKETTPLHVLVENQLAGYPDLVDMSRAPVGPGQTKTVRITLEHVSEAWNQSYPDMELVNLKLK
jgi:high-affinity K+ transport system ATPase subunit B